LTKSARLLSLTDPKKKMSKSGDAGISLADSPDEIRDKIKRAVTDSGTEIAYSPGAKPAISNLLTIYSEMSGKDTRTLEKIYAGKGYAEFKKDLAEVVVNYFADFRKKRAALEKKPVYVREVLQDGAKRAMLIAEQTLREVKNKVGFF